MRESPFFGFLFSMWVLMLIGGGIAVVVLGPISITGFGELNGMISSGIKGLVAIVLVVLWIFTLSKLKNKIFQKQIKG
jgi:hypothetical protein